MNFSAVFMALASAVLFGLSAPIAKLMLAASHPWMLAGVLCAGAGVGPLVVDLASRGIAALAQARLSRRELPWLDAAVLSGGVIGPVLPLVGLSRLEASAASSGRRRSSAPASSCSSWRFAISGPLAPAPTSRWRRSSARWCRCRCSARP